MHMNQVHKENLTHVENANPGRQGLEIEIFGMEGVPGEIIEQHNQQVTQAHFAEEAERARLTGNPVRGLYANGTAPPNKRPKVTESLEEIEARADKYREDRKNGVLPLPPAPADVVADSTQPPFYPPGQPFSPATNGGSIPPRPGSTSAGALPPRPGLDASQMQSSIDDLIAGSQNPAPEKKEKSKKDKNMRLIYNDDSISPEEKMARLPRFAEYVRV